MKLKIFVHVARRLLKSERRLLGRIDKRLSHCSQDAGSGIRGRLCHELRAVLVRNILLLEMLVSERRVNGDESVMRFLPVTYRLKTRTVEKFFPNESAMMWVQEMLRNKRLNPPPHPERLIHQAMDGTMVRSVSEVIIYDMLLAMGFTFVYEAPYYLKNGKVLHPTFTILKMNGQGFLLIEHDGGSWDIARRTKAFQKMEGLYMDGLNYGEDIIYSFGCFDGGIDARRLLRMIELCA